MSLAIPYIIIIAGSDYIFSGPQMFALDKLNSNFTLNVTLINDDIFESNETFQLNLIFSGQIPPQSVSINPAAAQITILDNDCKYIDYHSGFYPEIFIWGWGECYKNLP